MKKIVSEVENFGNVEITLKEILDKNNITRNALAEMTGIRYSIIDSYYKNKISRLDLYTIAKVCYVLECEVGDILQYRN